MITVTYEDHGLAVNLSRAPQVTTLQLQKWMTQVVEHLHAAVDRNIGDGGLIGRRTGNLARALRDRVFIDGGTITGEVWPDPDKAPYGRIQEEGGTVIPKRARFLAIPLDAMLTGNKVARGTAAQVFQSPAAFGFLRVFVRNGVIFGTRGMRQSLIPLFALKSSVTIPGLHYLDVTLRQELTWIIDALERITDETAQLWFGEASA